MAGRFLLQKFSGTSRSTSLLGAHASASATAAAPIIPRASFAVKSISTNGGSSGNPISRIYRKYFPQKVENSGNPIIRKTDLLELENRIQKSVSSVQKEFYEFSVKHNTMCHELRTQMTVLSKSFDAHSAETSDSFNKAHVLWIKNTLWSVTIVIAMFHRYNTIVEDKGSKDTVVAVEIEEPKSDFGE